MNLFGTVLTHIAPSANYRGESEENRAVIQKVTFGRFEYPIISPESMRNALRELFRTYEGVECNRERLHDEEQLAVKFKSYPNADKYIDDFFMGWLIAAGKADRAKHKKEMEKHGIDPDKFQFRRDSVLRMNMAVGLEPFRHSSVFTQSPLNTDSPWKNAEKSQLLHRETAVTAFQYPFAINLEECRQHPKWTQKLLQAIGELSGVAGNHARSYFEMAPSSIVLRLTKQMVAGYNTYGFRIKDAGNDGMGSGVHKLSEIVDGIKAGDLDGQGFYLGGKVVKDLSAEDKEALEKADVVMNGSPQKLLAMAADEMFKFGK